MSFAVRGAATEKLAAEGKDIPSRRLACLLLDDPSEVVMGHEPVYAEGAEPGLAPVGYVTSADQGYTIGQSIAYAWLPAELAEVGSRVEIAYFDSRLPAAVAQEPLLDPEALRMRA